MILGILKETNNDKRVSLLPEQAAVLVAKQVSVIVETGAGSAAYAADATYTDKNVSIKDRATVLSTADLKTFAYEMEKHESIMSEVLETITIKEALFDDFKGVIKSLGAWGGDFVLVISKDDPSHYFNERGFETILRYDEMILK